MDIEKLTKDVILQNMTPEQQKAVLDSVMASVQENKKVRTQKVAENVDLVMQALKKIEAKMLDRVSQAADKVETVASNVKDGKDGRDGKDGKDGKQGIQGPKGADGRNGTDGKDGKDGRDGIDGVSVVDAFLDFDNSLVIELSNGKQINVGAVLSDQTAEKVQIVANGGAAQPLLDAIAALQAEINALIPSQTGNAGKFLTTNGSVLSWAGGGGGLVYQGTWNASSNSPTLVSSTGVNGYYYVVGVSGSTNLDGISDWVLGDWVIFNGTMWQKIDNTDLVTSVAGRTGAITLSNNDVSGSAASGANSDITSMSGITGAIGTVDYVGFDTGYSTTLAAGSLGWDGNNTLGIGMAGGNVIQRIGEDTYFYVKASSAITKGQVCMFTGAVGASGVVTAAPATGVTNGQYIMGIAAESMALNGFGLVQCFGTLKNVNTTGFTDGDIVYYDSAVTGGFTKTFPTSGPIVTVAAVVNGGSSGAGSVQIRVSVTQRVSASTGISVSQNGTGTTITNSAPDQTVVLTGGTGITTSGTYPNFTITNSSPDRTVVLTGAGTTSITGTYPNFTISSSDAYTGTVTSVSGTSPIASTGGTTPVISLSSGYGDIQNPYASKTANYVLAAPNGSSGVPTFRALVASDIPTLNQNTTGSAATVTTTISSGATATTQAAGDNSTKVATTAYVNAITGTAGGFGFKNRIINGAMMIDQRNAGASVTPATGNYVVDRWQFGLSQSSKLTSQRSTTAPTGFVNSLLVTSSSAYTVLTGDYFFLDQPIEGLNVSDLAWGTANASTVTLSFWVRSSLTGTFGGSLRNNNADRSYPFTYTINSANTFEQKIITIAGDTTGTWATDTSIGIKVSFGLGAGSTYSGTAGSWSGANYVSATGATSVVGTNGATFYITGVQLEKGSTATSFDYRPYGTELALCQRYFYKVANYQLGQASTNANTPRTTLQMPVTMRSAPTLDSGASFSVASGSAGTPAFLTGTGSTATVDEVGLWNSSSNWTVGAWISINCGLNSEL